MDEPEFDSAGLFDEDYLYFYANRLNPEVSDADTDTIWRLLELEPGMRILDLACGYGRIANRLAARGCRVTGLDSSALFLDRARRDAAEAGVEVNYVEGDMRQLPWDGGFDRVVNWFTAYGYFDDEGNRQVLREVARVLRPGGRFVLEIINRDRLVREFRPEHLAGERDGDFVVDRVRLDLLSGRSYTDRIIVRGGRVRRVAFFVRLPTFTELRDWLLDAGFSTVDVCGEGGSAYTIESRRMIVTAVRG